MIVVEMEKEYEKILFIGDRLQLPPIGETLSTAFTTVDVISLTDVIGQKVWKNPTWFSNLWDKFSK